MRNDAFSFDVQARPIRRRVVVALLAAVQCLTPAAPLCAQTSDAADNLQRAVREGLQQPPGASSGMQPGPVPTRNAIVLPDLGDPSTAELSPQAERRLGEKVMREIRADADYLQDPLLSDYLNAIGARLIQGARSVQIAGIGQAFDGGFEFFAVRDRNINAFALPGGYIGIHTALLIATQNEAELASVLSHEIGHVTQKHIARMMGQQGQNSLIAIAGLLLAALAASRSPDAAQALALGGQALAVDNQLSFSRGAEREADRIGFQILESAGYDVNGMADFFLRLQRANSIRDAGVPTYVRTHPLTLDRMADMQDRARFLGGQPQPTAVDYTLMRARARVLQQGARDDLYETRDWFANTGMRGDKLGSWYGVALISQRLADWLRANAALQEARRIAAAQQSIALDVLGIELARQQGRYAEALQLADAAVKRFPLSRAVGIAYGEALMAAGQPAQAEHFAEYRSRADAQYVGWWDLLANARAAQKQLWGAHRALAEKYALQGAWNAALEQLRIARDAGDANFYQLSEIDVRTRQFEQALKEDKEDKVR